MTIHTPEEISTAHYYYVQVFTDLKEKIEGTYHKQFYTICFASSKSGCLEIVNKWLDDKGVVGKRDIHLYLKNYKINARKMVADGNYI